MSHLTQSTACNGFAELYCYCSRISQAIFQADNVLEPAVLREMFKLRQKVTKIFLQLNHMFAIFRWRRSISILNIGYQYFVCLRINAAISFLPHLQVEEINVDGLTWEDVCLKIPVVKKPKCMDQVRKILLFNNRVKRSQIIYRYSGVEG